MIALLLQLAMGQSFSLDHVVTSPGVKEATVRAVVERSLASLDKCAVAPGLMFEGDETDDRVLIAFTTPVGSQQRGESLRIEGLMEPRCATPVVKSWAFWKDGVRVEVWLRAKVDVEQSRARLGFLRQEVTFACTAITSRLGKLAPASQEARSAALKLAQADLAQHLFAGGKTNPLLSPPAVFLVEVDSDALVDAALSITARLRLSDGPCPKLVPFARNTNP